MKVAVFCGADNKNTTFDTLALDLGESLARRKMHLVNGGSCTGAMKHLNKGYLNKGESTNVLGIIPEQWNKEGIIYPGIKITPVKTLPERLLTFNNNSDAVVVFPGGFGTLHEMMYFLSNTNKMVFVYNINGYWDNLHKLFKRMRNKHYISGAQLEQVTFANSLEALLIGLNQESARLCFEKSEEQNASEIQTPCHENITTHFLVSNKGGFETLHDAMHYLVEGQIGLAQKRKIVFDNSSGLWDKLFALFSNMRAHKAITDEHLELVANCKTFAEVYEACNTNSSTHHDANYWLTNAEKERLETPALSKSLSDIIHKRSGHLDGNCLINSAEMPNDRILTIFNPDDAKILATSCSEISFPTDRVIAEDVIRRLLDKIKTLPNSAGLAAPQLGFSYRIFVYSWNRTFENIEVVINPKILKEDLENQTGYEACFSTMQDSGECKAAELNRMKSMVVEYIDREGKTKTMKLKGFAAKVFQHEMDHLNGIVCINAKSAAEKTFSNKEELMEFMKSVRAKDSESYVEPRAVRKR